MKIVPGGKQLAGPVRYTSLYNELQIALDAVATLLLQSYDVNFSWNKDLDAAKVELALGPNWDEKIELTRSGSVWTVTVPLRPGLHHFMFYVDDVETYDKELPYVTNTKLEKVVNSITVVGLGPSVVDELEENSKRWQSILEQRPMTLQ